MGFGWRGNWRANTLPQHRLVSALDGLKETAVYEIGITHPVGHLRRAALIYGAKKWIIYPPHHMIMSNKQILDYYETDMKLFSDRGVRPVTCVQTAGE